MDLNQIAAVDAQPVVVVERHHRHVHVLHLGLTRETRMARSQIASWNAQQLRS